MTVTTYTDTRTCDAIKTRVTLIDTLHDDGKNNTGGWRNGGKRRSRACVGFLHTGGGGEVLGHVTNAGYLPEDGVVDFSVDFWGLHRGHQEGFGLPALRGIAEGACATRLIVMRGRVRVWERRSVREWVRSVRCFYREARL